MGRDTTTAHADSEMLAHESNQMKRAECYFLLDISSYLDKYIAESEKVHTTIKCFEFFGTFKKIQFHLISLRN